MKTKHVTPSSSFVDPDDAPPWTAEQFERAEIAENGMVLRPASGTLMRGRGRPKLENAKQVVSLRLEPEIVEAFKTTGPGWQTRMGDIIRDSITRDGGAGQFRSVKGNDPFPGTLPKATKRKA